VTGPPTVTFGVGSKPDDTSRIAVDGRLLMYDGVAGIGEEGGVDAIPDSQVDTSNKIASLLIGLNVEF